MQLYWKWNRMKHVEAEVSVDICVKRVKEQNLTNLENK